MSNQARYQELSDDQLRLVHILCESYERAMHKEPPSIESQLQLAPDNLRSVVFRKSLAIECESHRARGCRPDIDDYVRRFPDRGEDVQEVFAELAKLTQHEASPTAEAGGPDGKGKIHGERDNATRAERYSNDTRTFAGDSKIDVGDNGVSSENAGRNQRETMIGPYRLIEQIGSGGMGAVFLAEQTEPVERRVALKLIKEGMDSRQVITRFEAERQALARMEHDNIARVLDAGTTESGRPYFVMELVNGSPITKYCEQHQLTLEQRLRLFVSVCRAVQHAHQRGIIHRDIKPTNVLVARQDDNDIPKIIDFGIAKATQQRTAEQPGFTAVGQIIGTLEYMSPEQANLNQLDIDTRSDVYSLGVLLFELLTGTTPFASHKLRDLTFNEMLRSIREFDAPKPSTRLGESAESKGATTAGRAADPSRLARRIRGDLDWIVMKALEKDRQRRYDSASVFAADIERYLNDEPVEASPPSTTYRFRKFARRNRTLLTVATSILAILIVATIVSAALATWALTAEQTAKDRLVDVKAERDEKERQRARAVAATNAQREAKEQEAAQRMLAEDVLEHMVRTFRRPNPGIDGRTVTIADVLGQSVQDLQDDFADTPLTKARLLVAIGSSYVGLGMPFEAIEPFQQACELRSNVLGEHHIRTLAAKYNLATAYRDTRDFDKAIAILEDVVPRYQRAKGDSHDDTIIATNALADSYRVSGRFDKALPLLQATLRIRMEINGPEHESTLFLMSGLATVLEPLGRADEAREMLERVLALQRVKIGPEHDDTLRTLANLADLYFRSNRWDSGVALLEEGLAPMTRTWGPEHRNTLGAMKSLATIYLRSGRREDALPIYTKLQASTFFLKQLDMARERYAQAVESEGADHIAATLARRDIGQVLLWQGSFDEAETELSKVLLALSDRQIEDPLVQYTLTLLHEVGLGLDRPATKSGWIVEFERLRGMELGLAAALDGYVADLLQQGDALEAEDAARQCLAIHRRIMPDEWGTFHSASRLGETLTLVAAALPDRDAALKKFAEAEALLLEGYTGLQQRSVQLEDPRIMGDAIDRLTAFYETRGLAAEAEKWRDLNQTRQS